MELNNSVFDKVKTNYLGKNSLFDEKTARKTGK